MLAASGAHPSSLLRAKTSNPIEWTTDGFNGINIRFIEFNRRFQLKAHSDRTTYIDRVLEEKNRVRRISVRLKIEIC